MTSPYCSITDPAEWGRFTAYGSESLEAEMRSTVATIVSSLAPFLSGTPVRCLALIGGYGRGEGGVETLSDGRERPHNNLDLLLIGNRSATREEMARIKAHMDGVLHRLAERFDLGLDLGWTTEARLDSSPGLIMWYDMRHGHKTLWGDRTYIPSLTRFTRESIPAWDARNLLVNRGTLLVINDALRGRGNLTEADRRILVRHSVKAIIGYGDALLYFLGQYDWSYQEKRQRVRAHSAIPSEFQRLYEEAAAFRLQPQYDLWLEQDPDAQAAKLRAALAPIHLQVESLRLGRPHLTWSQYSDTAFAFALRDVNGLRSVAKRLYYLLRDPRARATVEPVRFVTRLGCRAGGPREMLAILFPQVAYHLDDARYRALTRDLLQAIDTCNESLSHAYLKSWGTYSDINFSTILQKLHLDLDQTSKPMEVPLSSVWPTWEGGFQ